MPSPKEVFVNCDELEQLPAENRENYLFELEWLARELPHDASVLQVGSMDGMRALRLLEARPDLSVTGLEIEPELVKVARRTLSAEAKDAAFVEGDITDPPAELSSFAYALCLNNTLGYIPDVEAAVRQMRRLGDTAVVSVYGERFDAELSARYFEAIGLAVREVDGDTFVLEDFSSVRRFPRDTVASWGGDTLVETPIGYLTVMRDSDDAA